MRELSGQVDSVTDVVHVRSITELSLGGIGRWAWFLPLFVAAWGTPKPVCQFFHDQLAAFLKDHVPDPSAAHMTRV